MTEYVENQFNCFWYKTEIHNARKTFNFFIKLSINFLGRFLRRTNYIQKTPKLISNKKKIWTVACIRHCQCFQATAYNCCGDMKKSPNFLSATPWGRLDLSTCPCNASSTLYEAPKLNPLSANPTNWSNTLNLPTNCLSVFHHFVISAHKRLIRLSSWQSTEKLLQLKDMVVFNISEMIMIISQLPGETS